VRDFIRDLLGDEGRAFVVDLTRFVEKIAGSGFVNSLAQMVLKMTLPGVPDIYQGCELWDFSLVDPDNRRPVDFELRRQRLAELQAQSDKDIVGCTANLMRRWPSADIKLWMSWRCLEMRREWPEVFSYGEYIPLTTTGRAADHIVAFARRLERETVLVAVPRQHYLLTGAGCETEHGGPQAIWEDTRVLVPDDCGRLWDSLFAADVVESSIDQSQPTLEVSDLFATFPVALFRSRSD
jgi:(1->4)-alpha-D-glucan 1-alpha-D-glucosylmutase